MLAEVVELKVQAIETNERLERVGKELRQIDRRLDVFSTHLVDVKERVREVEDQQSPKH